MGKLRHRGETVIVQDHRVRKPLRQDSDLDNLTTKSLSFLKYYAIMLLIVTYSLHYNIYKISLY